MMNNKSKNIFLITLVLLFVINIVALITIISRNKKINHPQKACLEEAFQGPEHFRSFMQLELGLSESQMESFKDITHKFMRKTRVISRQIRKNQNAVFEELKKDKHDEAKIDKLTQSMADDYIKMKKLSNQHFLDIKEVLNKEQQEIFFSKMKNASNYFGSHRGGRNPRQGPPHRTIDSDTFN